MEYRYLVAQETQNMISRCYCSKSYCSLVRYAAVCPADKACCVLWYVWLYYSKSRSYFRNACHRPTFICSKLLPIDYLFQLRYVNFRPKS